MMQYLVERGGCMRRATSKSPEVTRNTRSRSALLKAAHHLLAEGGGDLSVVQIARVAEVSPQTLYNHFDSKESLLTEAKSQALKEFESYMFERGKSIESPLEEFAVNLRLFGRAPDTHPYFAALITNSPLWVLMGDTGYSPVFATKAKALVKLGLIKPRDLEISLIATASLLEHVIALRVKNKSISEKRVDEFVYHCLFGFGISEAKARKLVQSPLPPWTSKD